MAKTVVTTDDLDGSPGAETITFSYAGTSYEIDLGKKSLAAFDKAMKPYLDAARPAAGQRAGRTRSSKRTGRAGGASVAAHDLAAVRAWADANGYQVSTRGRIAQAVLDAYDAANG